MSKKLVVFAVITMSILGASLAVAQQQQQQGPPPAMTFFVTSVPIGNGGNLGGIAGADAHCQMLAAAAGAGNKTWRAYLSTQGPGAVNARDRIGAGPWHNAKGVRVAANVADLHGDNERDRNYLFKETALDEKGNPVKGRGDQPNQHDMLTGSDSLGRAFPAGTDRTCNNWSSNSSGNAMLGHHDRSGGNTTSWNSAHPSRSCSQPDLVATGGAGLFYCFATN
jgi:hypothetical protein